MDASLDYPTPPKVTVTGHKNPNRASPVWSKSDFGITMFIELSPIVYACAPRSLSIMRRVILASYVLTILHLSSTFGDCIYERGKVIVPPDWAAIP